MAKIKIIIEDEIETHILERNFKGILYTTDIWGTFMDAYKSTSFANPVTVKIHGLAEGKVVIK